MYVYRPVLAEGCLAGESCVGLGSGGGLPLPGFGVELAIKNMEYSALDDSKVGDLPVIPCPSDTTPQRHAPPRARGADKENTGSSQMNATY